MGSIINSLDCYAEFNDRASVVTDLCNRIILDNKASWSDVLGMAVEPVSIELALQEPLLQKINVRFPIHKTTIIRTPPYHSYNWHIDRVRGVSINLLISTEIRSHCVFGTPIDEFSFYLNELEYRKNTFYLFNTQRLHQVLNFSRFRYLFTVEFLQDKTNLLYSDVYNWCKKENLLR